MSKPLSNPNVGLFAPTPATCIPSLRSHRIKFPIKFIKISSVLVLRYFFLLQQGCSHCPLLHLRRLFPRGCVEKIRRPHSFSFPLI